MDPIAGFVYVIIFIGLVAFLAGGGVAVAAAAVLRHLDDRLLRVAVLGAGMVLSFVLFAQTDAFWLLIGALLIGTPMAVLVPPLLIFGRPGERLRLSHVLLCYVAVAVPGVLLPFALLASDHSTLPPGGVPLYLCLLLADIAAASVVYLLIGRVSAVLRRTASAMR
jgi:hypothetical protein